ncbi:hypothetical protein Lesp01_40120 [Lentzea sp. NBRC 102530]|nr:hypothetical protein Lesp01_40120 [Lentzea sp. NBRC 102530]
MSVVLAGDDDRLADVGVPGQHGLDLAGLDPEPADLHLVVGAAQVVQGAVGQPPHAVTGAVHAFTGFAERVREEPVRGQPGTAEVAAGELDARQVQFSRHANGNRREVLVQHVGPCVGQRTSDDRPSGAGDPAGQGVHSGLGRAVEVVARGAGHVRQPSPQVVTDRFAAQHQHLRPVLTVEQTGLQQLPGVGRRQVQEVDPLVAHVPDERGRVEPHILVQHVQLVAVSHQHNALQ